MNVREARADEVQLLQDLWRDFSHESPPPDYVPFDESVELRQVEDYVRDGQKLAAVAEDDGNVVGFALARLKGPKLAYLADLYVVPEARRRGAASALARRVVAWAHERGAHVLELEVQDRNAPARGAYERWGMRPTLVTMMAPLDEMAARLEPRGIETFGSVFVQTDDVPHVESAVAKFVPRLGRSQRTDVRAPQNGWVRVDDELCSREPELLRRLARELSNAVGAVTLSLGVEREVVRFVLHERGRLVDEYVSVPNYFGELPPGDVVALAANPTVVSRLTGADPARVRAVARTASSPAELPPPRELLRQIAETIGVA